MFELFYVLTMAIAFTNYFDGKLVPFYIKYIIALMWIGIAILKKGKYENSTKKYIKLFVIPYLLIAGWSMIVWLFAPPEQFSFPFFTRLLSNTLYLIITYLVAAFACDLFKKRAVYLSLVAMFISTISNVFVVTKRFGTGMLFHYLVSAFNTTSNQYGSMAERYATYLEVQDITMASGLFILFFVFFEKECEKKKKWACILMSIICAYIGFKRTVFISVFIICILLLLLNIREMNLQKVLSIIGTCFIIITFLYIVFIDAGLLSFVSEKTGIDFMGRITIYKTLSEYINISPLFLGNGFTYVDKIMYESIGFATHSVIIRMFAEIGFIPYFVWIYHYLIKIPKVYLNEYGDAIGKNAFLLTIYIFISFFMENTLSLFCVQFSYFLIIHAMTKENNINISRNIFYWEI